jgi:AraC family transcriptional regulator
MTSKTARLYLQEGQAAQTGLQQSYFRQIFQQTTGLTLHSYIMQLRLERARDLLGNSELPLAAIAEEVGFSNQSHMTSCFRRHYDITPALLRHQRRSVSGRSCR